MSWLVVRVLWMVVVSRVSWLVVRVFWLVGGF